MAKEFEALCELLPADVNWGDSISPAIAAHVADVAKAKEREAHDYTKGKLAGALAALRQLQECVPPKDWKRYASEVLALDARDRERSNVQGQGDGKAQL